MGGKSGGVAGYRYYLGLHFGLCHALSQSGAGGGTPPVLLFGPVEVPFANWFHTYAARVPSYANLSPLDIFALPSWTIEGRYKLNNVGDNMTPSTFISYGDAGSTNPGANNAAVQIFTVPNSDGLTGQWVVDDQSAFGGSGPHASASTIPMVVGDYYHVALVNISGGSGATLYVNGVSVLSIGSGGIHGFDPANYTYQGAPAVCFGSYSGYSGSEWACSIKDVRVTPAALYTSNFTLSEDGLVEIRAGDRTAWAGLQQGSGTITINAPTLFGGDKKEGGIQGDLDVLFGEQTQGVNTYLLAKQGNPQSAHRGVTSVVFKGGLIGANNPYPKPWSFRLRRTVSGWFNNAQWYPEVAGVTLSSGVIGMNPAHIIYETLTNPDWGMGYPTAALDDVAFRAAALALSNEGFGINMLWNRQDTIESFLQKIVDYIAGVVVTSPITGLFQLKLIRGDYTVGSLPVFTAADVLEVVDKEDAAITNGVNEMWIKYFDPISKQTQSVALQALGAVQSQQVVISDRKDFTGIATADLAARVCQRELRATTVPLKRVQLKMKRTIYKLTPGDVFVLNFPAIGLSSVVFRLGDIDTGTLLDGSISITAVEDVFSMPADTYIAVQTTGWTPPNNNPVAAVNYLGYEADFRTVYKQLGGATANALPAAVGYCGAILARPDPLCQSYGVYTVVGGGAYVGHATAHFAPTGVLASSLSFFDTAMTLNTMIDTTEVVIGSACLIVDTVPEIVRIDAIDPVTGICTIARGCVDTVGSTHTAGARVYFLDGFLGSDGIEYTAGETVHNKDCPNAPFGQLELALAPIVDVTIAGRALLPYPPAFPKINGTRFDLAAGPTGPFTLAWIERNRLTQADVMVDQTAATVTPETGTTYTVRVIDTAGPTLLATYSGLTATSQLINAGASAALSIELESVRGGLTSLEHWAIPVTFTSNSSGIIDESGTQIDTESSVDIFSE